MPAGWGVTARLYDRETLAAKKHQLQDGVILFAFPTGSRYSRRRLHWGCLFIVCRSKDSAKRGRG